MATITDTRPLGLNGMRPFDSDLTRLRPAPDSLQSSLTVPMSTPPGPSLLAASVSRSGLGSLQTSSPQPGDLYTSGLTSLRSASPRPGDLYASSLTPLQPATPQPGELYATPTLSQRSHGVLSLDGGYSPGRSAAVLDFSTRSSRSVSLENSYATAANGSYSAAGGASLLEVPGTSYSLSSNYPTAQSKYSAANGEYSAASGSYLPANGTAVLEVLGTPYSVGRKFPPAESKYSGYSTANGAPLVEFPSGAFSGSVSVDEAATGAPKEVAEKQVYDLESGQWTTSTTVVQIAPQPFSKGTFRRAYRMLDALGQKYVAKAYKASEPVEAVKEDAILHSICQHYAELFNAAGAAAKVEYLPAFVLQVAKADGAEATYLCEPFVPGEFRKYNDNAGQVHDAENGTPQAFSHFTYCASRGKLMVVDVQGVGDVYTDPTIHSHDKRYGALDWGQEGFANFFKTHTCNAVCRSLGLQQPPHGPASLPEGKVPPGWARRPPAPRGTPLDAGLYMCGRNAHGQLGLGTTVTDNRMALVPTAGPVAVAACGDTHTAALVGGRLYAWGCNDLGQLGIGYRPHAAKPQPVPLEGPVEAVALGLRHSAAVVGGRLFLWGDNSKGQLGLGSTRNAPKPKPVALPGPVAAAALGGWHSLALVGTEVLAWGSNQHGQLGLGHKDSAFTPQPLALAGPATAVAAGSEHSAALVGGKLYTWGRNRYGQLGLGTSTLARSPKLVPLPGPAAAVALGHHHSAALVEGRLYVWGQGAYGQLGLGHTRDVWSPRVVALDGPCAAVALGGRHSAAIVRERVYSWGACSTDAKATLTPLQVPLHARVVAVALGGQHSALLLQGGRPEDRQPEGVGR